MQLLFDDEGHERDPDSFSLEKEIVMRCTESPIASPALRGEKTFPLVKDHRFGEDRRNTYTFFRPCFLKVSCD